MLRLPGSTLPPDLHVYDSVPLSSIPRASGCATCHRYGSSAGTPPYPSWGLPETGAGDAAGARDSLCNRVVDILAWATLSAALGDCLEYGGPLAGNSGMYWHLLFVD